jgi:biotin transport system substrate-specific component
MLFLMLRTLPQTRNLSLAYRLAAIAAFTVLTIISARITIPVEPVPFTMQTFAVILAGLVLGARDGALSQLAYLGLIALNFPVDARMLGVAALTGPTAGFLIGFVAAAFVAGWITERSGGRWWLRVAAALIAGVVIHLFGVPLFMILTSRDLPTSLGLTTAPYVVSDVLKALLAASVTEGGRSLLMRR